MKKFIAILLLAVFTSFASAQYFQDYWPAYSWARDNKIITDSTFWGANLYSVITRVEFAQFIQLFAKNVLRMKDPTETVCKLYDLTSLAKEYRPAVQWVCDKWIMWKWVTIFDWNATLTLAEFATTVSRLFWWESFSYWDPYYKAHLWALKGIWAVDDISEPFTVLFRWDVLVMLMNSVASTTDISKYKGNSVTKSTTNNTTSVKWTKTNTWAVVGTGTWDSSLDKISQCYAQIDNCEKLYSQGWEKCEYVCCDKDWNWVGVDQNVECADRPSTNANSNDSSANTPNETTAVWPKANCWLESTDSEDVEECWRCIWLPDYTEESFAFWAEKNDGNLVNCNEDWECSLKKFRYVFDWWVSDNEFHSMVLDLNYEDVNGSADKWLSETFSEDDIKLIKKCEEQRYYIFDKKKNDEKLWL